MTHRAKSSRAKGSLKADVCEDHDVMRKLVGAREQEALEAMEAGRDASNGAGRHERSSAGVGWMAAQYD